MATTRRHNGSEQTPLRTLIYTRISEDRGGEKAGVQRQERECRESAERRGWTVTEVLSDNDISAYSGKPRPSYQRLIEAIKNGEADALICWHPDRLHRSTRELDDFIGLVEATGIEVATVQAGDYDLTTASGRMTARVVAAVARGESEHKSERHRSKHRDMALQGRIGGGGTRPFGYEKGGMLLREEEAAEIRIAAKKILAGDSVRGIVRDWIARGIKTSMGNDFTPTTFRRLLLSGRIAGLREHNGEVVAKAMWSPIITEATRERLLGILNHPSRMRFDGSSARRYLLTGFLTCGLCEAKLVARPKDDHRRAYFCAKGPGYRGCGQMSSLAEPLEALVFERVVAALDGPALTDAIRARADQTTEEARFMASLDDARARLDELSSDYFESKGSSRMPRSEYLKRRDAIENEIDQVARSLARFSQGTVLSNLPTGGEALREAWATRGLDWRRNVLSAVVEKVVARSAKKGLNKFDESRFEIVWRA